MKKFKPHPFEKNVSFEANKSVLSSRENETKIVKITHDDRK